MNPLNVKNASYEAICFLWHHACIAMKVTPRAIHIVPIETLQTTESDDSKSTFN